MAFPWFSMLCDSEFQQRWEFRNREVDSSSDDAKSGSGTEPTLKKHKPVPGLIPAETDDPAQSPERQEETVNPEGGHGVITPNPKEATRRHSKGKTVKKEKEIKKRSINREYKKTKAVVYDTALLDDLQKFRESLIEQLRVERENLSEWMKDEMSKMVGTNGTSIGAESNKEADHVNKHLFLQCRSSERPKKNAGDSRRSIAQPSGRSSRRKKKADSASCSQVLANEKQEMPETADKLKFPPPPWDHSLQLQQNSLSSGHKVQGLTAMIEERGESLELIHSSYQQSAPAAASNFLIKPGSENHQLENSLFNFPLKFTGKNMETDEISGYYHMLQPEGRSSYPNQMGPKNSPSIQTISPSHLYRDMGHGFSNMITDPLPSENPLGDKGNVLGLQMSGQQVRFPGHGNGFI